MTSQLPNLETTPPLQMIKVLGVVAMIAGTVVVVAYQIALPSIIENRRIAREAAIKNVIDGLDSFQQFLLTPEEVIHVDTPNQKLPTGDMVYVGYDSAGELLGIALEGVAQGYGGTLRIMYSYSPTCECVTGMRLLDNKETPGFGDKANTDPDFVANFNALEAKINAEGTALANPIETVKHGKKTHPWQIDAISGATVTSKAIGKALSTSAQRIIPLIVKYLPQLKEGKKSETSAEKKGEEL